MGMLIGKNNFQIGDIQQTTEHNLGIFSAGLSNLHMWRKQTKNALTSQTPVNPLTLRKVPCMVY